MMSNNEDINPGKRRRVLHLTGSLSRSGGGVTEAVWGYVRATQVCGVEADVVGFADPDTEAEFPPPPRTSVHRLPTRQLMGFNWAPTMPAALSSLASRVDLFHLHGLRSTPGLLGGRAARQKRRPLLVSPHGMLYPQLLRRSRVRKFVVSKLWDNRILRQACCFHATSIQELDVIRAHGLRGPVAVVPIGLDPEPYLLPRSRVLLDERWPELHGKRLILYLGLLEPKKGLLNLVGAWRALAPIRPDWHLVIAGPDRFGHEKAVRQAIEAAELWPRVSMVGPAYGDTKLDLLASASLFVLPSEWENFGIAIAEALAAGLPVITTKTTPWPCIESEGCGWWVDYGEEPLIAALSDATSLDEEALKRMGGSGRTVIRDRFSWGQIGARMAAVYGWIAGAEQLPTWVDMG